MLITKNKRKNDWTKVNQRKQFPTSIREREHKEELQDGVKAALRARHPKSSEGLDVLSEQYQLVRLLMKWISLTIRSHH